MMPIATVSAILKRIAIPLDLNVVRIELPPPRARRADIPLITEAFYARVGRRPHSGCSPLAVEVYRPLFEERPCVASSEILIAGFPRIGRPR